MTKWRYLTCMVLSMLSAICAGALLGSLYPQGMMLYLIAAILLLLLALLVVALC